jgi:hypothetical protein
VSGGEPCPSRICRRVHARLRARGLHTRSNSGAVPWDAFEAVLPQTDLCCTNQAKRSGSPRTWGPAWKTSGSGQPAPTRDARASPIEVRITDCPGKRGDVLESIAVFLREVPSLKRSGCALHDFARSKFVRSAGRIPCRGGGPGPEAMAAMRAGWSGTGCGRRSSVTGGGGGYT